MSEMLNSAHTSSRRTVKTCASSRNSAGERVCPRVGSWPCAEWWYASPTSLNFWRRESEKGPARDDAGPVDTLG
jgi:hypothetical protein